MTELGCGWLGSSRAHAARALGEIGDIRAIEPLLRLKIKKASQLSNIRHALVKFKSDSTPVFIKHLSDRDPEVVWNSVIALEKIGDKRAIFPLIKIIEENPDPELRAFAGNVMRQIVDRS